MIFYCSLKRKVKDLIAIVLPASNEMLLGNVDVSLQKVIILLCFAKDIA